MYDFVPRIDATNAERTIQMRPIAPVAAAAPSGGAAGSSGESSTGSDQGGEARREQMASAADYARVQARISQILTRMSNSGGGSDMATSADNEIESMLPRSTVIIPLPPATTETIERALKLARDMVSQAQMTRAAQANLSSGTVNQMMAGAA